MAKLLGYARVSTLEQNAALQHDALAAAGCWKVFTDHVSGAKESRPQLDRALEQCRDGDTLVVWRLDRLGRSLRHLRVAGSHAGDGRVWVTPVESMVRVRTGQRGVDAL